MITKNPIGKITYPGRTIKTINHSISHGILTGIEPVNESGK
jgi:hypothetical protein